MSLTGKASWRVPLAYCDETERTRMSAAQAKEFGDLIVDPAELFSL